MSHLMTALAMQQKGLKSAAKVVLYWLADHHNETTGLCFPSLSTLEEECQMSRATIVRHLKSLEEAGLIVRERRHRDNGSQTSTSYSLRLEAPVSKLNSPCFKMKQPPVSKCDPHNLGNINLGNEPSFALSAKEPEQQDEIAFGFFCEVAKRVGWPAPLKFDASRKRALLSRVKDAGGWQAWADQITKAEHSDFLSGRKTGSTPASFDWLHKKSNFTKLMEGNYDNRSNSHDTSNADTADRIRAVAAAARRPSSDDCFRG